MLILVLLVTVVAIPMMASQGKGYRGLYVGAAIGAAAASFIAFQMAGARVDLRTVSADAAVGIKFMRDYFPNVGGWLMAVALGAAVGSAVFKKPKAG